MNAAALSGMGAFGCGIKLRNPLRPVVANISPSRIWAIAGK
jgi:hypothetical protein